MIGIISDAHGNQPAFQKAIMLLQKLGAQKFIFLGDAIGYLPTPAVLDTIKSLGSKIQCIRGNHEDILLNSCYQPELEAVYQHRTIHNKINDFQITMIESWKISLRLNFKSGDALFVHGSPQNPTYEYVYPDYDLNTFNITEQFVFMGHTHRPFIRKNAETIYVNVGSCGLPRDHGKLGSAALFNEQTGLVRIIRFDIRKQLKEVSVLTYKIHSSVLSIQQREPSTYEGELIDYE